ncbi:linker for activation of T-cells family member 2 isoform X2 [Herpailurus yagouaroundi]|uniref:linker for activation of T-cells family member 2 isoform X2 n=1 Tax=Herpailurus yagouaroundi TaxID=1608482 RepID=UPI001AD71344|nr:linker for activation of T-cells family member 2 isoform X2 [Puma yagouaroundi]
MRKPRPGDTQAQAGVLPPGPALQDEWLGADMNVDAELLWPGVALLLLLGTVASLCVRCSRPVVKKSEKIYEQRSLEENAQNFAVARTYSLVRQAWPGPLLDTASDVAPTRKDKLLRFSPSVEDSASSRYLENFSKGSRRGSDGAFIDPIATHYYNWGQFQKPLEDDDDANSYENVLICKRKDTESGDEGSEDYQNSASIRQWRESRRVVERGPREASPSLAGSPDEEPDYVNESVAATEA